MLWWAYIHTNGSLQVKRFFNDEDIAEASESPFCNKVTGPFEALDRERAIIVAQQRFGGG